MQDNELAKLVASIESTERIRALHYIQENPRQIYFSSAEGLIEDDDNDVRWQALIAVGQYIESSPDRVWSVVVRYAATADGDMRDGIATVILEHLLAFQPETYVELCREEMRRSNYFRETLTKCWNFGEELDSTDAIADLLAEAEKIRLRES